MLNERVLAFSDATFAETTHPSGFATDDRRTGAVTHGVAAITAQRVSADEWNRLPWLPDEPRTARGIDFELIAWAFGATLLIASTSYSAGVASLGASQAGPNPFETMRSSLASTTGDLLVRLHSGRSAGLFEPAGRNREQVPSKPVMTTEEGDRVAAELTLVQDITSGPYDPSPVPNAPY